MRGGEHLDGKMIFTMSKMIKLFVCGYYESELCLRVISVVIIPTSKQVVNLHKLLGNPHLTTFYFSSTPVARRRSGGSGTACQLSTADWPVLRRESNDIRRASSGTSENIF